MFPLLSFPFLKYLRKVDDLYDVVFKVIWCARSSVLNLCPASFTLFSFCVNCKVLLYFPFHKLSSFKIITQYQLSQTQNN